MGKTRRPKRDKVAPPREGKPEGDEPKFRLRPQRPRTSPQGDMAWSIALKTVYRYARNSGAAGSAPIHLWVDFKPDEDAREQFPFGRFYDA